MKDFNRPWAAGLRSLILLKLKEGPKTTAELAKACRVSPSAIAPRMSELEMLSEVVDTGDRRSSVSGQGRKLKVWALASAKQKFLPNLTPDGIDESSEPVMRLLE